MTTDALTRLQDLLNYLFQFDSKELDFGIYRIMNHKRGEIRRFIDEGLPRAVEETLKGGVVARQAAQADDLQQTTDPSVPLRPGGSQGAGRREDRAGDKAALAGVAGGR